MGSQVHMITKDRDDPSKKIHEIVLDRDEMHAKFERGDDAYKASIPNRTAPAPRCTAATTSFWDHVAGDSPALCDFSSYMHPTHAV